MIGVYLLVLLWGFAAFGIPDLRLLLGGIGLSTALGAALPRLIDPSWEIEGYWDGKEMHIVKRRVRL